MPIVILASKIRSKSDIRTSIIDLHSTFFLLSFVKILTTSFELLVFTEVVELCSGNIIIRVLFLEPSVHGVFQHEASSIWSHCFGITSCIYSHSNVTLDDIPLQIFPAVFKLLLDKLALSSHLCRFISRLF